MPNLFSYLNKTDENLQKTSQKRFISDVSVSGKTKMSHLLFLKIVNIRGIVKIKATNARNLVFSASAHLLFVYRINVPPILFK